MKISHRSPSEGTKSACALHGAHTTTQGWGAGWGSRGCHEELSIVSIPFPTQRPQVGSGFTAWPSVVPGGGSRGRALSWVCVRGWTMDMCTLRL